jgi:putative intracellular protease/amidase
MQVLVPLPDRDFDTTEVAVPWRLLTDAGHTVTFATEAGGQAPACAGPEAVSFYRQLAASPSFADPVSWQTVEVGRFDGLLLPGGHAPGMRQYLGSLELQHRVAEFWTLGRPVGAICHGVLVLARSTDPATGHSLLAGRRTTCLPKYLERSAYAATAWRLGRYYRTYPAYVEDEVRLNLDDPAHLERGPRTFRRGTAADDRHAFVVEDGTYLSARWPGDAYLFARRFAARLATTR